LAPAEPPALAAGGRARPGPDGTLVNDVVIGDWRRPWNLRSDRPLGGIPSSSLWATDPAGFGQVGCIYTAQGFEYDYAGVIIGPDLVWRGDRWQANPWAVGLWAGLPTKPGHVMAPRIRRPRGH